MATQKIETGLIADSAVTTAKLADNSVTAAKIAAGSLDDQVKGISSSADAVAITIDSSEKVTVGSSLTSKVFNVVGTYENTGFYRDYSGTGVAANYVYIGRKDTNGALVDGVRISGGGDDAVAASHTGYFELSINKSGTFIPLLYSSNGTELVVNENSVDLDFRVESNGNSGMLFVDAGNDRVGIGTISPAEALTVNGNIGISDGKIYNGASSNSAGVSLPNSTVRIDGYNGITFHSSSTTVGSQTERMRIDSSGKVGIGTDSPSTNLDVRGGSDMGVRIISDAGGYANLQLGDANDFVRGGITYNSADDSLQLRGYNNAERLRIDSSGLVGIGISNPSDYNASARNLVVGGSGDTGISIVSGTASNGQLKFADGTGGTAGYRGAVDYNHADDSMSFNTAATRRFKINGSGSAGLTQADGDYLARLYEQGADGYLALYTGEATPLEQTRVSSYGQTFFHKDQAGLTSTNRTMVSIGTDEQSAAGAFHVSDAGTLNGGIRQSTHSSRVYTNVSSIYTQVSANRYWHIKTNIQGPNNIMYIARVHGYAYGNSGHIIDLQRSGYAYASHGNHTASQSANNGSSTSHTLVHYFASDNYLCFKCDAGGGYFTGLSLDIKFQSPTGYNWNYRTIEHQINNDSGSYY